MLSEIQTIFREFFDDETMVITEETTQNDIEEWDSMAQIILVASLEKHFQIKFRVDEIAGLKSIQNIMEAIRRNTK